MMLKVGEVKVPTDADFEYIKTLCLSDHDWHLENKSTNFRVWLRDNELCKFKAIRSQIDYDNISAEVLYDVLQDADYRLEWDDKMFDGYEICYVSPFSYIEYYALKFPHPFKNRDFVTQRCWLDFGPNRDKIIFNHSVNHAKCPPKKNFVRGISFVTAVYIKMFKKLTKAVHKYEKWKSKHRPHYKPWVNPEQITIPRLDMKDILPLEGIAVVDQDESMIHEKELKIEKSDLDEANE